MDDMFLIIINIISAAILIGYVVFRSIKRKRLNSAADFKALKSLKSSEENEN